MLLIKRIDAHRRHRRDVAHLLGRHTFMQGIFRCQRTQIAIAERIIQRPAFMVQPHIIHRPAIHGNRSDTFSCDLRAAPQPFLHTRFNRRQAPAQRVVNVPRCMRKPMHQRDVRLAVRPAQQGDATALGPQIHGYEGFSRIRPSRTHRRYASTNPPSTGIKWPVVQGVSGPARNRIACAQSLGSMGLCVNVRMA